MFTKKIKFKILNSTRIENTDEYNNSMSSLRTLMNIMIKFVIWCISMKKKKSMNMFHSFQIEKLDE